jgi:serpin B
MYRVLAGLCVLLGLAPPPGLAGSRPGKSRPAAIDTAAVRRANNRFAVDLYARLRSHAHKNLFFSSFSLYSSLAMTSAGARGDTLAQMQRTLHLPAPEQLHPALGRLLSQVTRKEKGCQVHPVNSLFAQRGLELRPDFLQLMRAHYQSGLRRVDFAASSEEARRAINEWVEKRTQERIRNLLRPGTVGPDTTLILTSAIHFKGDWAEPFPKDATREGPFHAPPQKPVQVPFMSQTGKFAHVETAGAQVLELPYVGTGLSMVVLLPRKAGGLADLEKVLTADRLEACLKALRPTLVQVTLPRFRLLVELQLRPVLSDLGMPLAFARAADFSGMDPSKQVQLSAVVHKAALDVNEQGTEASAAAATAVKGKSATPLVIFRADRPFVFLIRDSRTGCILFLGRVMHPRG